MIFLELFLTFFKIGAFTFGGGYAMLPLIQSEALDNGWLTMEELIDFIAVSESTPGPFAINMATFVGTQMGKDFLGIGGGILGAICATLGVVMPSFIVILCVAKFYQKFK
jgi:chromate transporter